jgi:hypothetical protein
MIIKTTDFQLGAFIPNRDDAPNSDIIGNEPILQGFIDTEVEEILVELLGYELFSLLENELDGNGDLPIDADQKWLDLVNGKDNYRGLKRMLVAYVFYKFILNDRSQYSTTGTHEPTSEAANRVEPSAKAIAEYQKFYKFAIGDYYYGPKIVRNVSGMKGVIYGSYGSQFASLYDFLAENQDTYAEWVANMNLPQHNLYDI